MLAKRHNNEERKDSLVWELQNADGMRSHKTEVEIRFFQMSIATILNMTDKDL